jgi:hypothetical protein
VDPARERVAAGELSIPPRALGVRWVDRVYLDAGIGAAFLAHDEMLVRERPG